MNLSQERHKRNLGFFCNNVMQHCTTVCSVLHVNATAKIFKFLFHDRYRLRSSTPAQLCWSSSRLQPLQNNDLIKFAIIRPSNLNHDKNLWNCRGAPDETTCLIVFFRCPSALALICMKLFNVCANKLSLSVFFLSEYSRKHDTASGNPDQGILYFN